MNPPCGPCQRDGGWKLTPNGTLWPPRESEPPFTGKQTDIDWRYEPMCAHHAAFVVLELRDRDVAERERLCPPRFVGRVVS